ncbi:MAG: ADP-ribosylglycohydrolase family protein [Spirochaetales bacterium]|nr:ADP-ribosylglycohydrolase family protein [Spirochaetales bacterium]
MSKNKILDGLFGLCVGDALGVPVEFKSREYLKGNPVKGMSGYGTHNQPPGTWSDDSSLAFCLADSLCNGYDLNDVADKSAAWYYNNLWTPYGEVFDIGNATRDAIERLKHDRDAPRDAGGRSEYSNGNGSLMRILPVAFMLKDKTIGQRVRMVSDVSSITHGHLRSVIACVIYIETALNILSGLDLKDACQKMKKPVIDFYSGEKELSHFSRILQNDISAYPENGIKSSGYVVHTLEASLWCLLTSRSYGETVLKAVNLGEDTDTTGAVAGGLAGLYYGMEGIPPEWVEPIARKDDIVELAERLSGAV